MNFRVAKKNSSSTDYFYFRGVQCFCHDENYCDDDNKRGDGVRWVDRKIILHRLYLIMMEMIAMMTIKEVIVIDGSIER